MFYLLTVLKRGRAVVRYVSVWSAGAAEPYPQSAEDVDRDFRSLFLAMLLRLFPTELDYVWGKIQP